MQNIYQEKDINKMLDNDEITPEEEAFMSGYLKGET